MVTKEARLVKKGEAEKKILDAALSEFALKGYQRTSTNVISRKAGVSKGLIFKYFPTKFALFYSVFSLALTSMQREMEKTELSEEKDVFDKMLKLISWKMEYALRHPQEAEFLTRSILDPPKELSEKIGNHLYNLTKLSLNSLKNEIDMSKFREEYTKDDVLRNIEIALIGLQTIYQKEQVNSMEALKSKQLEAVRFMEIVLKGMEK
jgi:TetR/AcrR family transcriptional regulator